MYHAEPNEDDLVPVAWSDETEAFFDGSPPRLPIARSLAGRAYRTGEPETEFRSELHVPIGDY